MGKDFLIKWPIKRLGLTEPRAVWEWVTFDGMLVNLRYVSTALFSGQDSSEGTIVLK